jgi:plasmid maintenance system antidote protein VapI
MKLLVVKGAMSADFAVLISKVLKSSPKMWMNLQIQLDIWKLKSGRHNSLRTAELDGNVIGLWAKS